MGGGAAIILWLLVPIIIVLVVVMVSRSRERKRAEQAGAGPLAPSRSDFHPPPPAAEHPVIRPRTVVATFNSSTGWAGKEITYFEGQFIFQGHGPITAAQVLNYDRQGQLGWSYEGLREWVVSVAMSTAAAASVLVGRGVGIRFVAQLIDGILVGAVWGILALGLARGSSGDGATAALGLLLYGGLFVYYWWFEAANGWTVGKLAVGLRVVMEDGSRLTVGAAFLRTLVRLVDFLPAYYVIGAIAVLSTKRNQRIGDLAARTVVVSKEDVPPMFGQPAGATSTFEPLPPSGSDSQRVQPNYAQGAPRRAVAGFALSLVGFIMPILWPVGLVLSWRDIRREKRERQPHGLSLAGLVVSAVGTTAVAVLVVAFLAGAPIPVLSNLRDTPGNSAVKEGIHTIQHGVEAWAADHGGVYPRSGRVSQAGLAEYVDAWPDNPYTLLPMTHGTDRGDFYYTLAEGFSSFSLTGYGDDDKAIIEVR